jgi:hypothetical protein
VSSGGDLARRGAFVLVVCQRHHTHALLNLFLLPLLQNFHDRIRLRQRMIADPFISPDAVSQREDEHGIRITFMDNACSASYEKNLADIFGALRKICDDLTD